MSTLFVSILLGSSMESRLNDCNRLTSADPTSIKKDEIPKKNEVNDKDKGEGRREKEGTKGKEEGEKKGTYRSTGCPSQKHLEPIIFIRLYCAIS